MTATLADRFWAKVDKTDTCWLWTAGQDGKGYGKLSVGGRMVSAHRFAYELLIGPISEGLELDHLCRVRNCVNPEHLEPVTHQENVRRGAGGLAGGLISGQQMRAKTHCPQGHPYDGGNTHWYKGWRYCRACRQKRSQEWRRRGRTAGVTSA